MATEEAAVVVEAEIMNVAPVDMADFTKNNPVPRHHLRLHPTPANETEIGTIATAEETASGLQRLLRHRDRAREMGTLEIDCGREEMTPTTRGPRKQVVQMVWLAEGGRRSRLKVSTLLKILVKSN